MQQYKTFELAFSSNAPEPLKTDLHATFTCGGENVSVKGFYDGDGVYKVRFLPRETGLWRWKVSGAVTAEGEERCEPADSGFHGLVKAAGTHFAFEDGEKYLPFGTTVYALIHQPDEIVRQTLDTLAAAPFNKVRMCVFPKFYDLVTAEPPYFPFERGEDGGWDVHRPNILFWHRLERCLDKLEDLGIQADLILFHPYDRWGFSEMTMEQDFAYLDTVIRRLAARPNIWWSMANEYDLLHKRSMEDWYAIEEYITTNDPYGHLLSNHNCTAAYDYHRAGVTHVSIQTSWIEQAAAWQKEYKKPVIYDEMCYEGNLVFEWGNISAFELVHRFWAVCSCGAYATHGETFIDENNVIWWACGGRLKGQSAPRIAFLKELLYELPGHLEPMEEMWLLQLGRATEEQMEDMKKHHPSSAALTLGLRQMDPGLRYALFNKSTQYGGHCGEAAYLNYYGRTCPFEGVLRLPEDGAYRVEVIDIWEMSRKTVMTNAHGTVKVSLPSKEGMAILAVREKETMSPS